MFTKRTTTFASTSTLLALVLWCSFQDGAIAQYPSPAPQQVPQDGATDTQNAEHTQQAVQETDRAAQKAQDAALTLLKAAQVATTKAQEAQVAVSAALMAEKDAAKAAQKAERAKAAAQKKAQNADSAAEKAEAMAKATKKEEDVAKAQQKRSEAKIADGEYAKESLDAAAAARNAKGAAIAARKAEVDAEAAQAAKDDAETALRAPGVAVAAQEALDVDRAALTAVTATQKELGTAKRVSGAKNTFEKEHPTIVTGDSGSCLQPVVERTGAYYSPLWRPMAGTDYIVLGYDARNHFVKWYDYKHQGAAPVFVDHNGSLVPVVYSREKVLVHVCGLHPTDTVSISTNDVSVPEQGADIRGVTATTNTAAPLAPTLDALGSASAAGIALSPAGFSFGAPPTVTSSTTTLFTPGTSKDGSTYADATIGISPEALALEMSIVTNNANDAIQSIDELETGPRGSTNTPPAIATPGSVEELQQFATTLLTTLQQGSNHLPAENMPIGDLSLSGFNDYLARTQTLVTQINGLASGVNLASISSRAVALRQNFEAIMGVLTQVNHVIYDNAKYKGNYLFADFPKNTKPTKVTCDAVHTAISSGTVVAFADATGNPISANPPDNVTCHAMELYTMEQFMKNYTNALSYYGQLHLKIMLQVLDRTLLVDQPEAEIERLTNGPNMYSNLMNSRKTLLDPNIPLAAKVESATSLSDTISEINSAGAKPSDNFFNKSLPSLLTTVQASTTALETLTQSCRPDIDCVPKALEILFNRLSCPDNDSVCDKNQALRNKLEVLDNTVGQIFGAMNNRYEQSWVEQTDALPPLTSNSIVRIGINVQRNYTPFTLSGGATIGAASPASTQSPASNPVGGQQPGGQQAAGPGKGNQAASPQAGNTTTGSPPSGTTSTSGSNDITVLMEVHRYANFNLVGGAMAIKVPSLSITPMPEYGPYGSPTITTTTSGTTTTTTYTYSAMGTCNGGTTPMLVSTTSNTTGVTPSPALYYCYQTSQTSGWQPAGMAGVAWFPFHRDYFSRKRGDAPMWRNMVPSLLFASSITSLGSAFVGPNFEPINGIDFFAGYATAHQLSLPKDVSPYVVYPASSTGNPPTLNLATHEKGGISFGVGFDLSVFLQLFSKTQGPSLP
jgi:hypothetical protein